MYPPGKGEQYPGQNPQWGNEGQQPGQPPQWGQEGQYPGQYPPPGQYPGQYQQPPYGQPPYGYYAPPPPQPPASNGCLKACIIGLVVLGIIGMAGIALFIFVINKVVEALPVPPTNGITGKRTAPDSCTLLTRNDVVSFMGNDVTSSNDGDSCNFNSSTSGGYLRVKLDWGNHEDYLYQKKLYGVVGGLVNGVVPTEYSREASSIISGQIIEQSGLGDEAFSSGSFLVVRKGEKMFNLSAFTTSTFTNSTTLDQLKSLARIALTRL